MYSLFLSIKRRHLLQLLLLCFLLAQFQNCGGKDVLSGEANAMKSSEPILETDLEIHPAWIDTTRLAGYWKLDDVVTGDGTTISDSSAYSYWGLAKTGNDGLSKSDTPVKYGRAFYFDGIDDSITIANPTDKHLDFNTHSFSYMLWVKVTSSVGLWDMPIWKGGNSAAIPGYDMELGTTVWAAYVSDGLKIFNVEFGKESDFLGRWVHLAVVVDRTQKKLLGYVNGSLTSASDISTLGNVNSTQELKIGTDPNNTNFKGAIDDVAIWNTVLSSNEVAEIYKRTRWKF